MSDLVLVALIGVVGNVALLVLGGRLNGKVNRVRDQVVNGHSTNLREEADERHTENSIKLDQALTLLHRLEGSVTRLWEHRAADVDRIHELELTQEHKPAVPNPRKKKAL